MWMDYIPQLKDWMIECNKNRPNHMVIPRNSLYLLTLLRLKVKDGTKYSMQMESKRKHNYSYLF
jgi:hypothetical protein